jgi:hypothetical protein
MILAERIGKSAQDFHGIYPELAEGISNAIK